MGKYNSLKQFVAGTMAALTFSLAPLACAKSDNAVAQPENKSATMAKVETTTPTGLKISGQPIDRKTAKAWADYSNKEFGKEGFRSRVVLEEKERQEAQKSWKKSAARESAFIKPLSSGPKF